MARSSPKFGSVTITPSISSRLALEQVGATRASARSRRPRVFFPRGRDNCVHARLQNAEHLFAPGLGQVIGKESSISNNHAEGHFTGVTHTVLLSKCQIYVRCFLGERVNAIGGADHDQKRAPPNLACRLDKTRSGGGLNIFVQPAPEINTPLQQQRQPIKNQMEITLLFSRHFSPMYQNITSTPETHRHHPCPKYWPLIQRQCPSSKDRVTP